MTTFAGWQLKTYIKTGSGVYLSLDGVQRVTYNFENNVDIKEECGTRYVTLVEGSYGVAGTLERFYTGSGTWGLFGISKGEATLDYCELQIWPNGSGSAKPFIQLSGLKMNRTGLNHRPTTNLMIETWDFIGTGSLLTGSGT